MSAARLDDPRAVRPGEELPVARLGQYLRDRLGATGELVVQQFPSGYSNLTYLLRLGETELVLRRPPFGNRVASAHDMGREFRVLAALSPIYPAAPRPLLECQDLEVLGAPFYVMERRRGVILRGGRFDDSAFPPAVAQGLGVSFAAQLASLHRLDFAAVGLADLGRPEGYVRRQVEGWTERFHRAKTSDLPELEETSRLLAAAVPADTLGALVHNDFKYDNLVLDPQDLTRIVAVLDWEMATVGDPRLDLGTSLAYWVEAGDPPEWRASAFGPTWAPGSPSRREIAGLWSEATGIALPDLAFVVAFGLLKLAVIGQQIFYRYVQGSTHDPRFAELDRLVALCAHRALAALETGEV